MTIGSTFALFNTARNSAAAKAKRGTHFGAADFAQRLAKRVGRSGQAHEWARQRHETDKHRAERLVKESMNSAGWTETELVSRAKGNGVKAALAAGLHRETPMTRAWIAQRLGMGSATYVAHLTKWHPAKETHPNHCRFLEMTHLRSP